MIYEAVWKEPGDKYGSAVVNVVSQIRRKIGEGYIETMVGSEYRFVGYSNPTCWSVCFTFQKSSSFQKSVFFLRNM